MRAVVDIFGDIVSDLSLKLTPELKKVNPGITGVHYFYGHWIEVSRRLLDMSEHRQNKKNRFPLVLLLEDIPVDYRGEYPQAQLQVFIMYYTNPDYNSEQRQRLNFDPVLTPIYNGLMSAISRSPDVVGTEPIPHRRIDRKYFGRTGIYGNLGNITQDYVDAVQIQNLELKFFNNNC